MKRFLFLTMTALLTSCTSNQQQTVKLSNEIDSLKQSYLHIKKNMEERLKTIDEKITYLEFGNYLIMLTILRETQEGYIRTFCTGTFSNSATTNSELGVQFIIDKSCMRIQLYEYNRNHPIKGEGFLNLKPRGLMAKLLEFKTYNAENGSNFVEEEYFEALMTFYKKKEKLNLLQNLQVRVR